MVIQGTVAPGYESVRQLYEHNMRTLAERNTQLCIYVGEECVVDLWASAIDDTQFSADSLANVFSSGKSLEAITLSMLVDRGLLDYKARITDYWPEFGANGKGNTTIADLMRHEAGLAAFDTTLDPGDLHPKRLRENTVGTVIERQTQAFRAGADNQREYHAITRGWIANEIFRRVEPTGRTMGQFLREELSTPLDADVFIGLHDEDIPRLSKVVMLGLGFQFVQSLIPKALGRKIELNLFQIIAKMWRLLRAFRDRTRADAPIAITGMKDITFVNTPVMAKGETASAGANCSARGLAKIAALMANGGSLGEQKFIGDAAYAALHDAPLQRKMIVINTTFTQGGVAIFQPTDPSDKPFDKALNCGREGYVGWMGFGGSIFQWHREHRIGFGYVPTLLNFLDVFNERGKDYQAEVVKCVETMRHGSGSDLPAA